jgi:hypothetical protein
MTFNDVAASVDFGTPTAHKRGRNPEWPYVPVILSNTTAPGGGPGSGQASQIKGVAYATRDDAVAAAARCIEARRASLVRKLGERRNRALREQYGLPEELEDALAFLAAS